MSKKTRAERQLRSRWRFAVSQDSEAGAELAFFVVDETAKKHEAVYCGFGVYTLKNGKRIVCSA
jgi:hypothetical protein